MKRNQLYLAGPMFGEADQKWVRKLKTTLENCKEISDNYDIVWPVEHIEDVIRPLIKGKSFCQAAQVIANTCKNELDRCNLMVAILDGPQVDDGTAWEIGYFVKKGQQQIIGLRTDMRSAGDIETIRVNSLLATSCSEIVGSVNELIECLKRLS